MIFSCGCSVLIQNQVIHIPCLRPYCSQCAFSIFHCIRYPKLVFRPGTLGFMIALEALKNTSPIIEALFVEWG